MTPSSNALLQDAPSRPVTRLAVDIGDGLGDGRLAAGRPAPPGDGHRSRLCRLDLVGVRQQHLQHALRAPPGGGRLEQVRRRTPGRTRATSGSASVRVFLPVSRLSSRAVVPTPASRTAAPATWLAGRPVRCPAVDDAPTGVLITGSGESAVRTRSPRSTASVPRISGIASSSGLVHHRRHRGDRVLPAGSGAPCTERHELRSRPKAPRSGWYVRVRSRSPAARRRAGGRTAAPAAARDRARGRSSGRASRRATGCRAACRRWRGPSGVSVSIASAQVVVHSAVLNARARACSVSAAPGRVAEQRRVQPERAAGDRGVGSRRQGRRVAATAARAACAGSRRRDRLGVVGRRALGTNSAPSVKWCERSEVLEPGRARRRGQARAHAVDGHPVDRLTGHGQRHGDGHAERDRPRRSRPASAADSSTGGRSSSSRVERRRARRRR